MSLKKLVKFIKGRWFPLIAASIVVAVIVCVMILCGWRFTYAPELENNWEAVSGVSGWFGVVASFMAVWYAVRVADRQNQITLFEKKYELYEIVMNCAILSYSLEDVKTNREVQISFLAILCYNSMDGDKVTDNAYISAKQIAIFQKLNQIPFLFKNIEELGTLPKLVSVLTSLISNNKELSALRDSIQEFSDYIDSEDYKKLVKAMQKELNLN